LGKYIFLPWLLAHRHGLAFGLPAVSQVTASQVVISHEAGVSEFTELGAHSAFDIEVKAFGNDTTRLSPSTTLQVCNSY